MVFFQLNVTGLLFQSFRTASPGIEILPFKLSNFGFLSQIGKYIACLKGR